MQIVLLLALLAQAPVAEPPLPDDVAAYLAMAKTGDRSVHALALRSISKSPLEKKRRLEILLQEFPRELEKLRFEVDEGLWIELFESFGADATAPMLKMAFSLDNQKCEVARKTLIRLGEHAQAAVPGLMAKLEYEDAHLIHALERGRVIMELPYPRPFIPETLVAIAGKQCLPSLREKLKSKSLESKSAAAYSLGLLGADAKECVTDLLSEIRQCPSEKNDYRDICICAIGRIGCDPNALIEAVRESLSQTKPWQFVHCPEYRDALITLGVPVHRTIELLDERLQATQNPQAQHHILDKLSEMGTPAIPTIEKVASSPDPKLKRTAEECLDAIRRREKASMPK